jgi:hypothetical protein
LVGSYKLLQVGIEIFHFFPQCRVVHVSVSKQSLYSSINRGREFERPLANAPFPDHKNTGHHPDELLVSTGHNLAWTCPAQIRSAPDNYGELSEGRTTSSM